MVKTKVLTAALFDLLSWYFTAKSSTASQTLFPFKTKQNKNQNNDTTNKNQTPNQNPNHINQWRGRLHVHFHCNVCSELVATYWMASRQYFAKKES